MFVSYRQNCKCTDERPAWIPQPPSELHPFRSNQGGRLLDSLSNRVEGAGLRLQLPIHSVFCRLPPGHDPATKSCQESSSIPAIGGTAVKGELRHPNAEVVNHGATECQPRIIHHVQPPLRSHCFITWPDLRHRDPCATT